MMKKTLCMIGIAAMLMTSAAAQSDALSAFEQLTGKTVQIAQEEKTSEAYLDEVMDGVYLTPAADMQQAAQLAKALKGLCGVTNKDVAVYAQKKALEEMRVRNAYYRSLANVLRAQIMVNPASQEQYRSIQVILTLFLEEGGDQNAQATRKAIRSTMDRNSAQKLAQSYDLPADFVEFVIMDANWNDESWENDDDWKAELGESYGAANTPQESTPDYDTPDTPDTKPEVTKAPAANTPDTPDDDTPDTPQTKPAAAKKPASTKAPAANTPDTPDTPDDDD